jgi:excisionase family DNA binding protein
MEDWLTTFEAAALSGYNPDYIRQLIRSKKVQGRKWGLAWQVSRQSLENYMATAEKTGERRGPKHDPNAKRR